MKQADWAETGHYNVSGGHSTALTWMIRVGWAKTWNYSAACGNDRSTNLERTLVATAVVPQLLLRGNWLAVPSRGTLQ